MSGGPRMPGAIVPAVRLLAAAALLAAVAILHGMQCSDGMMAPSVERMQLAAHAVTIEPEVADEAVAAPVGLSDAPLPAGQDHGLWVACLALLVGVLVALFAFAGRWLRRPEPPCSLPVVSGAASALGGDHHSLTALCVSRT